MKITPAITPTVNAGSNRNQAKGSAASEAEQTMAQTQEIRRLQSVDTAVRSHEAAHLAAGGGVVTGGASFTYREGPDGQLYAVGGEVPIDASEGTTPEETVAKAQKIRSAALAPANPSAQDYKVASMAMSMEQQARLEIAQKLQNEINGLRAYGSESYNSDAID